MQQDDKIVAQRQKVISHKVQTLGEKEQLCPRNVTRKQWRFNDRGTFLCVHTITARSALWTFDAKRRTQQNVGSLERSLEKWQGVINPVGDMPCEPLRSLIYNIRGSRGISPHGKRAKSGETREF